MEESKMTAHVVTRHYEEVEGQTILPARTHYTVFGEKKVSGMVEHEVHPMPRWDYDTMYKNFETLCNRAGIPLKVLPTGKNGNLQRFVDLDGEQFKVIVGVGVNGILIKMSFIERPKISLGFGLKRRFEHGNFKAALTAYVLFQSFSKLNEFVCLG